MTNTNSSSSASPIGKAQTLPIQGLVNRIIRVLLRAPLLSRIMGKRLLIVYLRGRVSGRHYAVPVAYTRVNGNLIVSSQFPWVRNLRTGEPVHIRLTGRRRAADIRVLTDETDVVDHLAMMTTDNHQFAKFNRIRLDENGNPVPEDLHLAWVAGARVAVLTPR